MMVNRFKKNRYLEWRAILTIAFMACLLAGLSMAVASDTCPEIDDMPLDIQIESSPPNLLFMIDDSGSMDWEYSTEFGDGKLHAYDDDDEIAYIFDSPENFYNGGDNGSVLGVDRGDRGQWRATWRGFNKLYYHPSTDYKPWPAADGVGTNDPTDGRMAPADMDNPKLHPTVFLVDDNGSVDGDEDGTNTVDHERNSFDLNGVYKRFEAADGEELGIIVDNSDDWTPDTSGVIIDNEPVVQGVDPSLTRGIIIDNNDDGYSEANSSKWDESGSTPEWDNSSRWTDDNNQYAEWTHTFTAEEAASDYVVKAWWNCYDQRDENALFTITDANGDHEVYMDQRDPNCSETLDWITLGTGFTFNEGTVGVVQVKRTNSSTGSSTVADAVKFITQTELDTPLDSFTPYDESDDWSESTDKEPSWSGDAIYTNTDGAWAAWANEFSEAGTYKVQAWWPCDDDGDETAQITITDAAGTDHTFTVNQRRDSGRCGQWVTIGDSYDFEIGDIGTVKLERTHSGTDETWADAVRFVTEDELTSAYQSYEEGGLWDDTGETPVYNDNGRYTYYKYNWAEWEHQFTSDDDGTYTVQVFWTCTSNRDHEAKYIITDSDGEHEVTGVDQGNTDECGKWVTIGEGYIFADGTVGRVRVERQGEKDQDPHGSSTYADAIRFITPEDLEQEALVIINAHYYQASSEDDSIYLVNLTDPVAYYQVNLAEAPDYYKDGAIDIPVLTGMDDFTKVETPPDDIVVSSYAEARQNFANYFTYYRRRSLLSIAAVAENISSLNNVYIGLGGVNSVQPNFPDGYGMIEPLLPIGISGQTDYRQTLLEALYDYDQVGDYSSTPMRDSLKEAGQYYNRHTDANDANQGQGPQDKWRCSVLKENYPEYFTDDNCEPVNGAKGACQQNFTILFTDGYYNGGAPGFQNIDGQEHYTDDGTQISGMAPYSDGKPNTLADVAMYYYASDLADDIDNLVPTKFPDIADHQHMVTYTITFGVYGDLNPDDYTLYGSSTNYPTWPTGGFSDQEKIDDMWHAAVNARGEFHSADDPEELIKAFSDVVKSIMDRVGTSASASVSTQELTTDSQLYISGYNTDGWAGVITAWDIDPATATLIDADDTTDALDYAWNVAEKLEAQVGTNGADHADNRLIATWNPTTSAGAAFSGDLTSIHSDLTESIVNYLRGDKSGEQRNGGAFRDRMALWEGAENATPFTLADIIHSSPIFYNDVIYAGANDGMLHAFLADGSANAGKELFAYVPGLVHDNLKDLTDPSYTHKYYVDLSPVIWSAGDMTILVGGLGKGGKGYFALDVSDAKNVATEADVADLALWEFTETDMGYSFSTPVVFPTNSSVYPDVVAFGNGYASTSGKSVLYIVNPADGSVIKKFDTEVTGDDNCNGMSSPFPADINGDDTAEFIYVGDLKGNMWKFDISSSDYNNWNFAFSSKAPLFTATDSAGNPQPITSRPDVTKHCSGIGRIVLFGTGKYLGESDKDDSSQQALYGIWDYGERFDATFGLADDEYWTTHNLLEQTASETTLSGKTVRVMSAEEPDWTLADDVETPSNQQDADQDTANSGWYFNLPIAKERITQNTAIVGNSLFFVSNIPSVGGGVCSAGGGYSFLQVVDPCTGSRLDDTIFDVNSDDNYDTGDMVAIEIEDPEDPDETITVEVPVSAIMKDGLISKPTFVIGEDKLYSAAPLDPLNPLPDDDDADDVEGELEELNEDIDRGMTFWLKRID